MPALQTAVSTSVTNMVGEVIQAVGSPAQKSAYLPRLADGTYKAGSFCLTESGAGSDPSRMKTRARREGNGWRLDGEKLYISSAEYAGLFVVWAVTDPEAAPGQGHFLLPRRGGYTRSRHRQGGEEDGPARLAHQCGASR